jgi:FkbM family methyltransferase
MHEAIFETDLLRLKRCRYGHFLYYRHDTAVGAALDRHGEFGEEAHRLLLPLIGEGAVVLDVGANIGTSTIAFASRVGPAGRVLAFEPQPAIHNVLCANVALNGLNTVTVYPHAVADRDGVAFLPEVDYATPGNYGAMALAPRETTQAVTAVALDSLDLPPCALLKVDVEGLEHKVIQGAAGLIGRDGPMLYVEFNDGPPTREMLAELMGRGYRLYWHPVSFVADDNYFGQDDTEFQRFDVNILGVPPQSTFVPPGLRPIRYPHEPFDPALAPRVAKGHRG